MPNTKEIALQAAGAISEKKGQEVVILELLGISLIADYFVIATGNSSIHLQSLATYVEERLRDLGVALLRREGFQESSWILLDFGAVVIHLFREEERVFYSLERLWGDARKLKRYDLPDSD
ncbi:MAG TPA: ribosome silencing factor [Clostridia bacterium]|nr:ribosome silencing factor [Clostridia bacterium]